MTAIGGPPHIRHFLLHFLRMPGLYIFWPLAQQPSKSGFMLFVWKPYCMAFKPAVQWLFTVWKSMLLLYHQFYSIGVCLHERALNTLAS